MTPVDLVVRMNKQAMHMALKSPYFRDRPLCFADTLSKRTKMTVRREQVTCKNCLKRLKGINTSD